jgi:hypothetical protein
LISGGRLLAIVELAKDERKSAIVTAKPTQGYLQRHRLPFPHSLPLAAALGAHTHPACITEAEAAAIRASFEQCGELSAVVELRRLFPAMAGTSQARDCARTIAGWKPLPGDAAPGDAVETPRPSVLVGPQEPPRCQPFVWPKPKIFP